VLTKRLVTAAILLPIVVFGTLLLDEMLFRIILALVIVIAGWEYCNLISIKQPAFRMLYVFALTIIAFIFASINAWLMPVIITSSAWWLLNALWVARYPKFTNLWHGGNGVRLLNGLFTFVPMFVALAALQKSNSELVLLLLGNGVRLLNGLFTFVPMFVALAALQKSNSELVLLLLVLIWSADSGAYFAGKALGANKLCPRVSPGKTIEGMIGGTVASIAAMLFYLELFIEPISTEQYLVYVALSVVVSIVSVIGDLFESLHKRLANVKDSGALLPGHGGLFDRIDSLTSAAPVFCLVYYGVLL